MKYQVGDEILVLHSNEEGYIIEIMNDEMVMIEVRGVKFPAYMDQIDFPYFKRFSEKKLFPSKAAPQKIYVDQIPKEKIQKNDSKEDEGIWLNIIPKFSLDDFNDEIVESLKIFLSNRTRVGYKFDYEQLFAGAADFALASTVPPHTDFYIHDIPFAAVNDSLSFFIDFSLMEPHKKKADHFETAVKIKPKQLFQKIEQLKEDNKISISYPLFETYPDKEEDNHITIDILRNAGFKVYDASKIKQHIPAARSVIDLHIEKIVDRHSHLTNAEIIQIQLDEFEKWFELAQFNHLPSMVIIHGVGKGKLKAEIHDLLKVKKGVKHFFNQYSDLYGYGATEVFFEY
jgi:hypothetical protein